MANSMKKMGRPSIWGSKDGGAQFSGTLTSRGGEYLARARERMAALYEQVMGRPPKSISDADAVELALRGESEATRTLGALKQREDGGT